MGARAWAVWLLIALVVGAYWNSFEAGFVLDNRAVILDDPRIRAFTWDNVGAILARDYWPLLVTGTYRPVTTFSYLVNYAWLGGGAEPASYHAINLLLHLANVALVFAVLAAVTKDRAAAWVGAAVFGVHPVGTEAVTNIVGRADLLATAAVLGGLYCHVRATRAGARRGLWLTGLGLVGLLGAFAKESAVTLIGVIVAYDVLLRSAPLRSGAVANVMANVWHNTLRYYWVAAIPVALLFGARALVYADVVRMPTGLMDNPLTAADPLTARFSAVGNLARLVALWFWPAQLSCDYSYNQLPAATWALSNPATLWSVAGGVGLVAAAVLGWRGRRAQPVAVFLAAFFLLTLLPTSNLIILIGSVMGDRFLYLPGVGLAGLVGLGARWLAARTTRASASPPVSASVPASAGAVPAGGALGLGVPVWLGVVTGMVLIALAARTAVRNRDWVTDESLWRAAARVSPDSYKVHASLAGVLLGSETRPRDLDGCLEAAEKALRIVETAPPPVHNQPRVFLAAVGSYYRIKGDTFGGRTSDGSFRPTEGGTEWYRKAAVVLERAAEIDRATNQRKREELWRRGRADAEILDSGYTPIYAHLGDVRLRLSEYAKARESYEYYRHLNPARADGHLKLATLELARGQTTNAVRALIQAVAVDAKQQAAWQRLRELHLKQHTGCEAMTSAESRINLKSVCEPLRNEVCAAYAELYGVFVKARQLESARVIERAAAGLGYCPPERLRER